MHHRFLITFTFLITIVMVSGCAKSQWVSNDDTAAEDETVTDNKPDDDDSGDDNDNGGDKSNDNDDGHDDENNDDENNDDENNDDENNDETDGNDKDHNHNATDVGDDEITDTTEENVDTPSTSSCDGDNVDCYQECWKCALENDCAPELELCKADAGKSGCAEYRDCIDNECCDDGVCLTGDKWLTCINACRDELDTNDDALTLWHNIDKCVACDACPTSCVEKRPGEFHICIDEDEINGVDSPCYEKDAENDQVACYSWAGWGGPCSPWVQKCYTNPECWEMQQCYDNVWRYNDWSDRLVECENKFDADAVDDFYLQRQCVYCQACDISCLKDGSTAGCWEYSPLY